MQVFDSTIKETLNDRLGALDKHLDADVIFYYGEIHPYMAKPFRDFIEPLREETPSKTRLVMFRYEQARDLTVTLLKKWLVEYKFRDWTIHSTNPHKKGQPVTNEEKRERAGEIAKLLGDNKVWHSHGRMIGPSTLESILRLKVDDYSADTTLKPLIRLYNDLLVEYIARGQYKHFMHSRRYF